MKKSFTELLAELKAKKINLKDNSLLHWRKWAAHILKRRNLLIDLDICAYGQDHIVDKVKPFGGGSIFWSRACSGCVVGNYMIKMAKDKRTIPNDTKYCALLESGLLTRDQVKPGDIYSLPDIE